VSVNGRRTADTVLIAQLAAGRTQDEAARQAGVSPKTVERRLREPAFRAQVEAARREAVTRAVSVVAEGATAAAATLRLLLQAEAESVRLGAARSLMEYAIKGTELTDVLARLDALEARAREPAAAGRTNGHEHAYPTR
jgi:hypothetical protein